MPTILKAFKLADVPNDAPFLLVEDSDDDILLTRRAFQKANITNPLQVVRSVDEAILYLTGRGLFARRAEFPLPTLVLLDLKMPQKDGFDLLEWVRSQPNLRCLRIIVLTSSDSTDDIDRAYSMGANSFLVKPVESESFVRAMEMIKQYWISKDTPPQVFRLPQQNPTDNNNGLN